MELACLLVFLTVLWSSKFILFWSAEPSFEHLLGSVWDCTAQEQDFLSQYWFIPGGLSAIDYNTMKVFVADWTGNVEEAECESQHCCIPGV